MSLNLDKFELEGELGYYVSGNGSFEIELDGQNLIHFIDLHTRELDLFPNGRNSGSWGKWKLTFERINE